MDNSLLQKTILLLGKKTFTMLEIEHKYNLIDKLKNEEYLKSDDFLTLNEDDKKFLIDIDKIIKENQIYTGEDLKFIIKYYQNPTDFLKEDNGNINVKVIYHNFLDDKKEENLKKILQKCKENGTIPLVYDINVINKEFDLDASIRKSFIEEIKIFRQITNRKERFLKEIQEFQENYFPINDKNYEKIVQKIEEIMTHTNSDLTARHVVKTMEYMKFAQELLIDKQIKESQIKFLDLSTKYENEDLKKKQIELMKNSLIEIFGKEFLFRIKKSKAYFFNEDRTMDKLKDEDVIKLFEDIVLNKEGYENDFYKENLDKLKFENIIGAGLHDIGKIVVGDKILDFAGEYKLLNDKEKKILDGHDNFSEYFLKKAPKNIKDLALGHHGKLNNDGVSDKMSLITTVDMFDALVSPRSYKEGKLFIASLESQKEEVFIIEKTFKNILKDFENIKIDGKDFKDIVEEIKKNVNEKNIAKNDKNYDYYSTLIVFFQVKNTLFNFLKKNKNNEDLKDELKEIEKIEKIFLDVSKSFKEDVTKIILDNKHINLDIMKIFLENYDSFKVKFLELNITHFSKDIEYFIDKEKEFVAEIKKIKKMEIKQIYKKLSKEEYKDFSNLINYINSLHFHLYSNNNYDVLENKLQINDLFLDFVDKNLHSEISTFYDEVQDLIKVDFLNSKEKHELQKEYEEYIIKLLQNPIFKEIQNLANLKHCDEKKVSKEVQKTFKENEIKYPELHKKLKEFDVNYSAFSNHLKVMEQNLATIEKDFDKINERFEPLSLLKIIEQQKEFTIQEREKRESNFNVIKIANQYIYNLEQRI